MSTPFDTIAPATTAPAPTRDADNRPASERQIELLRTLMTEKCARVHGTVSVAHAAEIELWLDKGVSRDKASENITRLIDEAKAARSANGATDRAADRLDGMPRVEVVPAGRYAVDTNDGAINTLAFYKVDRPDTGRWAGYVFVKHLVGGGEERMSRAAGLAIMLKIAEAGAEAASLRYGLELGECGVCGITLTNDESRARGIGPVCAKNMGW